MIRTCRWVAKKTNGKLLGSVADHALIVEGVSTDTRTIKENQLYVPIVGERFDGHDFLQEAVRKGAVASLWSQDRPLPERQEIPLILVPDTLEALQNLAKAYREELDIPVVAITGSNGKTTTKDLIASVLKEARIVHKTQGNLNNHIGVPLTLLETPENAEVAVIEMGMNHAGEISLLSQIAKPNIAVITNIGESHIEFFGSREGIAKAKLEILDGLHPEGIVIYDGDEPLLEKFLKNDTRRHIRIGWTTNVEESATEIQVKGLEGFIFRSKKTNTLFRLPLLGRHNIKNALYAVEVGRVFGLDEKIIASGLAQIQLTGMRLELVEAKNGMKIINDAYNASPTSMRAALDLLAELEPEKEKWALLGDILETGEYEEHYHREIGKYAIEKGINRLYTVGTRARWIYEGAMEANRDPSRVILHLSSLEEATQKISQDGHSNVLLLSKASRAMQFDQAVKKWTEGA